MLECECRRILIFDGGFALLLFSQSSQSLKLFTTNTLNDGGFQVVNVSRIDITVTFLPLPDFNRQVSGVNECILESRFQQIQTFA